MIQIKDILSELKKLNLRKTSENQVRDILENFELYALPCFHIQKNSYLYRATILKPDEKLTKSRLSYCPAEKNLTYQRASCEGKTALYVTSPNPTDANANGNACELAMHEIWKDEYWNRNQISIIFSKWVVKEDIVLGAMHYSSPENNSNRLNKCAKDCYNLLIEQGYSENFIQDLKDFYEFLNNEFEKPVDSNFDKDYLITACFADIIREKEQKNNNQLDGLIWESHTVDNKLMGDVLSAAIYTDSVDTKLTLIEVYEDTFETHHSVKQVNSKIVNISDLK